MRSSLVFVLLLALPALGQEFRRALPGYEFEFPRDHFSHPEFQVEWWYFTGNLRTDEGRRFGFELTFFRNAVEGAASSPDSADDSPWDIDHIYLAHLALSDVGGGEFYKFERLNRGGPGLAGIDASQGRIWNGNWEVRWLEPEKPLGALRLRAVSKDFSFEFDLEPQKLPVIQGENGVSQKAEGAGKASHYVSYTRLATRGEIRLGGEDFEVEGSAWMDHEFFTNSLAPGQAGWDWVSAQLDDGSELMLYRMRLEDGTMDAYSSGTYVAPDGTATHLSLEDYSMTPGRRWKSPTTGGEYPLAWTLKVPRFNIDVELTTPLDKQEVVSRTPASPSYWEGAVDLKGSHTGSGYLEMTGYDKPIRLGVEPD